MSLHSSLSPITEVKEGIIGSTKVDVGSIVFVERFCKSNRTEDVSQKKGRGHRHRDDGGRREEQERERDGVREAEDQPRNSNLTSSPLSHVCVCFLLVSMRPRMSPFTVSIRPNTKSVSSSHAPGPFSTESLSPSTRGHPSAHWHGEDETSVGMKLHRSHITIDTHIHTHAPLTYGL